MCEIYVKVAGNWEQVNTVSVKIGGVWTTITEGWHKVGNAWRIFWQPGGFVPFTQTFYNPTRPATIFPAESYDVYTPCGATSATVELYGGGGSGAAKFVTEGSSSQAGSGGGGQYLTSTVSVNPNQKFTVLVGGLSRPGSLTDPNPYNPAAGVRQDGEQGKDSLFADFTVSPQINLRARGGGGGQPGFDNAGGGNQPFGPTTNRGQPFTFQAPSGQGGQAGGPLGGAGGQTSPFVAASPYGGGGAGGINGSDGAYGSPGIVFVHWT